MIDQTFAVAFGDAAGGGGLADSVGGVGLMGESSLTVGIAFGGASVGGWFSVVFGVGEMMFGGDSGTRDFTTMDEVPEVLRLALVERGSSVSKTDRMISQTPNKRTAIKTSATVPTAAQGERLADDGMFSDAGRTPVTSFFNSLAA